MWVASLQKGRCVVNNNNNGIEYVRAMWVMSEQGRITMAAQPSPGTADQGPNVWSPGGMGRWDQAMCG